MQAIKIQKNDNVAVAVADLKSGQTVSVNGQELSEPYAENKTLGQCNLSFPYSVPSNSYFVMGDNREAAMDSRLSEIGTVTKDRLIGKVVFSLSEFKPI